jgi:hypothetical protein
MRLLIRINFLLLAMFPPLTVANGVKDIEVEKIPTLGIDQLRSLQEQLGEAIDMEIADARCDNDNHCKAIAIGANPCGGPEAYKAYSTAQSDTARLEKLAAQYEAVRKTLHLKLGTLGTCVVLPEPPVRCENNRCVADTKSPELVF